MSVSNSKKITRFNGFASMHLTVFGEIIFQLISSFHLSSSVYDALRVFSFFKIILFQISIDSYTYVFQ